MSAFKYFPTFPVGAALIAETCEFCGRSPSISATRLQAISGVESAKAVCGNCLALGRARVNVPPWIEDELRKAVASAHGDWTEDQRAEYVASRVALLAQTPPIPWIQNNEWPVCRDDFATYVGELTRDQLLRENGSAAEARRTLHAIIKEVRPEWTLDEDDVNTAWEQLGNFVAVFVFRCADSPQNVYVLQTA